MSGVRVEDWDEDSQVDQIKWTNKDGNDEVISWDGEEDTCYIIDDGGKQVTLYRRDIPKLRKALEIAEFYKWHEEDY